MLSLISLLALPLALAAPSRRAESLSCVQYQYTEPYNSFGKNGFINLYATVTTEDGSLSETRVGVDANGQISPCGDCRSTQQFAFEVCQGADSRKGFNGLNNSPGSMYGHILFTNDQASIQCLKASRTPANGSSIQVGNCEYDYDDAGASGQYWQLADGHVGRLLSADGGQTFGINPNVQQGVPLTLFDGPAGTPFTYLTFKDE